MAKATTLSLFIALTTREALGKQNVPQQTSMTWYYNLFWTQKTHSIRVTTQTGVIYIYIIALIHQHAFFLVGFRNINFENPPNPPWLSATYYDPIRLEKHLDLAGCGWMQVIFGHIGKASFEVGHIMAYQPWIVAFNFCAENEGSPGNGEALTIGTYGGFLKWWYTQIIHFNRGFHYKPSILGYHYFRNMRYPHGSSFPYPRGPTKDRCFPFRTKQHLGLLSLQLGYWRMKKSINKGSKEVIESILQVLGRSICSN